MAEPHEELNELHEHAEEGHASGLARVSLTMAVLAVLVAVVGLLGHRAHTEEIILQNKSSDQWAYYQSHNIRAYSYEAFLDQLQIVTMKDHEAAAKMTEKYQAALERSRQRAKEISEKARELEAESSHEKRRADRFDLGEGLLEAALVITSITLLTRKRAFWYAGSVIAVVGVVLAATGFFVH